MANKYSKAKMESAQRELYEWLKEHGPATRSEIVQKTGWCKALIHAVTVSQPEWLVAVGVRDSGKYGRVTLYHCEGEHVLGWCRTCGKKSFAPRKSDTVEKCQACTADGKKPVNLFSRMIPGVDVSEPTEEPAGSEGKIEVLGARFDRGLPLWNDGDNLSLREDPFKFFQPGDDWDDD